MRYKWDDVVFYINNFENKFHGIIPCHLKKFFFNKLKTEDFLPTAIIFI